MANKQRIDPGKTYPLRELKLQPWDVRCWAYSLRDSLSIAQARDAIKERTGIWLPRDQAYSEFCSQHASLALQRQKWDEANSETEEAQVWFEEHMPDASPELRRQKIIERAALKLAAGDNLEPLVEFLKRWQDEDKLRLARDVHGLDKQRYQRDTCALFLKWYADERVKQIASSAAPQDEKVEKLGQTIFGDDWA
jgi:hypothetical protein